MKTYALKKCVLSLCTALVTGFTFSQNSEIFGNLKTESNIGETAYNLFQEQNLNASQNLLDANGNVLWDLSENVEFKNNINNIGGNTNLNQLQSLNNTNATSDLLSITLTNTNATSSQNQAEIPSTINNGTFLIWANNGEDLNTTAATYTSNLSAGITPALNTLVTLETIQRIWKVVETGGDISNVKIRFPQATLKGNNPDGSYYMLVSNTSQFDLNSEIKPMTYDGFGNLETEYDFNATKYITFAFSPTITEERAIYFDGINDYINIDNGLNINPDSFTISAWIKTDNSENSTMTILSKHNDAFTEGYDLKLLSERKVQIQWTNTIVTSNTNIPNNEWHHIAIIYDGTLANIYIDGVLDTSEAKSAPNSTNNSFKIAATGNINTSEYFKGHIDEVRVWDSALSEDQLRFIMNQEIENNSGQVMGKILPNTITKNDINSIPWNDLAAYYPMSGFTYSNTIDASGKGHHGELVNLNTLDLQSAPLPYVSLQNGGWDIKNTWKNGALQYIPGSTSIVNPNITIDWNIVQTNHNITLANSTLPIVKGNNRTVLGLYLDNNQLTVTGNTTANTGNGLTVTHYLDLNGKIDLEGESQLIQTHYSDLHVASNGVLEQEQQGNADIYTYKYWSSPVGKTETSLNNYKYAVRDVMHDGENNINFSSSGYDGAATSPVSIADYWIWKFANQPNQDYSAWQHIRRTGTINAGEGFTMKGPGTGSVVEHQNYVFSGKPNNGDISLNINAGNDYLLGNPYASAIDANQFIKDNGPQLDTDGNVIDASALISGTIYFWDHWGGNSHSSQNYRGGYAIYNYSGSVAAASISTDDPNFINGRTPSKAPRRYIPVGQGFFVVGKSNGTINFNNNQRVFKKEGAIASTLSDSDTYESDNRMKFRIGFNSINTIHRQLLLTIDEDTTTDVDWAYDAKRNENQMDDMYWLINDEAYVIQASDDIEASAVYPIGIITSTDGNNTITIDDLENVPNDINIYVHDTELNIYHNLRESDYNVFLSAGEYLERFEITFSADADALGINDETKNGIDVLYANSIEKIVLINPNAVQVKSIALYNILGQSVETITNISESGYSEYTVKNLSTGTYIIKLQTLNGAVTTKKVLVK